MSYDIVSPDGQIVQSFETRDEAKEYLKAQRQTIRRVNPALEGTESQAIGAIPAGTFEVMTQPNSLVEKCAGVKFDPAAPEVVRIRHVPTGKLFRPGVSTLKVLNHHLTWAASQEE